MSASHHIIRRYTFDVQFSAKAKAIALQDSLSSLFRRRLTADMDELLQQLLPEDMVAVLDTLELDLGTVLYKDMETQLPLKLLEALENALSSILRTGTPGSQHHLSGKVMVKSGSERLCELLEYYLLSGAMPWWASAAEREQPDQAIFQLAANAPALLAALIRKLGQVQYVRKRIAWQFSIAAIQQIINVLEPAEAKFILEYSREVLHIQQRQQVLQTESKALERAVWLFVLTYLLTDGGSNFDRKEFVRSHLTQMAHHFNVEYDALLQLFYDALVFYRQEIQAATIGGFIKALYSETHPAGSIRSRTFSSRKQDEQATAPVNILRYYLQFGSFPWWAAHTSLTMLYEALLLSARQSPAQLKEMLTLSLQQELAWKRWTTLFEPAQRTAVIMQLNDNWLLQANEQFFDRPSARMAGMVPGMASSEDPAHILLRDVILYRLLYGSIPWWGKTYAHFSVHSLLQQLMEQSVTELVMVFKYAGTLSYTMERFLSGITSEQFFTIARASGLTDMARDAYEQVYTLLQSVHRYVISGVKTSVLQQQVMKAFWRVWAEAGYEHFSTAGFTEEAVRYWAEVTGITPGSLVVLMKSALPAIIAEEEGGYQWLINQLQQLITVWQTEGAALYHAFVSGRAPEASQDPHPLIHFIRNNGAPATAEEKELSGSTITVWLRHFLEEGALPPQAGSFSTNETIWLSTRMLEWLYINYKEKLADIKAVMQRLPLMLNRVYSLWQVSTTLAPVRELLMSWMEYVLAPPEAGTMVVMDGLWQELPQQQGSPVREQRSTLPAAVSRLLHRFSQYDAITSATEKQEWLEQAIGLLTYFLAHKRLPDHLYGVEGATVQALLKQSVILLFREKPTVLNAMFGDGKGLLAARMEIYQVFTPPTGGLQENSIRQSLEAYAIEDSLLMLQETVAPSLKSAVSSFRDAVRFYKQQGRQERQSFHKRIFQYPVLVQYAAQQLDDDTFLEMMEDIEIGWGHPAAAALRELQRLFDRIINDSGEREKLRVLFRQFHIMLLTGQFTLPNATAYASRFLEFVMNNGAGIARNFIEQLVEVDEKTIISSYNHLRNILPALQQSAVKYARSHLHMDNIRSRMYEKDIQLLSPRQEPGSRLPAVKQPLAAENGNKHELPAPAEQANKEYEKLKMPEPDTVYVGNAGLVLLYPFLTFAFQRLGYVVAGQFTSPEAQIRAIHFLQYTVNLKEEHAEHELVLNKVLCNFPLEEPLPAELILKDEEKQLSQEMLQVVLQQWDRMKHTSVEGFREAFLKRDGALWETEEAWYMRVEQRGYDMILQTLPWSFGMLKTSWMDKMLYTEWVFQ